MVRSDAPSQSPRVDRPPPAVVEHASGLLTPPPQPTLPDCRSAAHSSSPPALALPTLRPTAPARHDPSTPLLACPHAGQSTRSPDPDRPPRNCSILVLRRRFPRVNPLRWAMNVLLNVTWYIKLDSPSGGRSLLNPEHSRASYRLNIMDALQGHSRITLDVVRFTTTPDRTKQSGYHATSSQEIILATLNVCDRLLSVSW
jgi:hypothetical protein